MSSKEDTPLGSTYIRSTDMACPPVDSSDLDQDWEKKRTPVRRKGNFWSENVYCIY